jgi:hypothetical protein
MKKSTIQKSCARRAALMTQGLEELNTTFRDRHPDVAPLSLEPQRRMTQSPGAQATQGKLLTNHDHRTNIRGRRLDLKVTPPPLKRIDRADSLAILRLKTVTQAMQERFRPMKHLPTMDPEAADHLGPLPQHPPTPT